MNIPSLPQPPQRQALMVEVVVPPHPVPTGFEVDALPDQRLVRIVIHRPSGIDFVYSDPESAIGLAESIRAAANQAKLGLTIANGSMLSTNGRG